MRRCKIRTEWVVYHRPTKQYYCGNSGYYNMQPLPKGHTGWTDKFEGAYFHATKPDVTLYKSGCVVKEITVERRLLGGGKKNE